MKNFPALPGFACVGGGEKAEVKVRERERGKYENENENSVKMPLLLITNNSTLNDDAAERESASECVVNTRNTTSNQEGSFN